MSLLAAFSICKVAKDAAGVAGALMIAKLKTDQFSFLIVTFHYINLLICRKCLCFWVVCVSHVSFIMDFEELLMWEEFLFICVHSVTPVLLLICRPTFRRIIRNGSTEMFSGLPYIYSLLNCLICMWYGTPLISADNLLITTVNSIGAIFQFVYIILFLIYAEKAKKVSFVILLEFGSIFFLYDRRQSSVVISS